MITILDLMIDERRNQVKIAFNLHDDKQKHGIRLLQEIFISLIANSLSTDSMIEEEWLQSAYASLITQQNSQQKIIDYFIVSYEEGKVQMLASIQPEKKAQERKRKIKKMDTE